MADKKATAYEPTLSSQSSRNKTERDASKQTETVDVMIRRDEERMKEEIKMDQWTRHITIESLNLQQESESRKHAQLSHELNSLKFLEGQSQGNIKGVKLVQQRIDEVNGSIATSTSRLGELDYEILVTKAAYLKTKESERTGLNAQYTPEWAG